MPLIDVFCWGQPRGNTPNLPIQRSFSGPLDQRDFRKQSSDSKLLELPKRQWSKRFFPGREHPPSRSELQWSRNESPQFNEKREQNILVPKPIKAPTEKRVEKPVPPLPRIPVPERNGDLAALFRFVEQHFSSALQNSESEFGNKDLRLRRQYAEQLNLYRWRQPGSSGPRYPPHLDTIPSDMRTGVLQIFDQHKLLCASTLLLPSIPPIISDYLYGDPVGKTLAGLEARMARMRRANKNVAIEPSITNRPDWYSDAVFAQQSFTGLNPVSITQASMLWIQRFKQAAQSQINRGMMALLSDTPTKQLFVQDYSYFRATVEASSDSMLRSEDGKRFGCAAVTLFVLSLNGDLHPVSIVLDFKGNMENSVVIFNRRLSPTDPTHFEAKDWPWRYAKMCHQVSDWTHHELRINLTECHFVQEAIIVATQRSYPANHIVYRLLEPHWLKTLSVNKLARDTLVPEVITKINGFTEEQTYKFLGETYATYDFVQNYLPRNLQRRGFPAEELRHTDFHNYAWARNMSLLYPDIHTYIHTILKTHYELPTDVPTDECIATWTTELQTNANLRSFPKITTLSELTDILTHIIFTCGPYHHSISHMQTYYQSFVPAKPPCLMKPVPGSLAQLLKYTEADLIAALPVGGSAEHNKIWLLASQFSWLCSGGVTRVDESWGTYLKGAIGEARVRKGKAVGREEWKKWDTIERAARTCCEEMNVLGEGWMGNWAAVDEDLRVVRAEVEPLEVAVSVLC